VVDRKPRAGDDGKGDGRGGDGLPVDGAVVDPLTPMPEVPPTGPGEADAGEPAVPEAQGDQPQSPAGGPGVPLEQHQRLLAEFDNYRKRIDRDRAREALWARAEILGKLLVTLDDMDRARASVTAEEKSFDRDGMLIIMDRFAEVLKREGLVEVPALPGDRFDPDTHEAVLMVPSDEVPEGCIAAVLEKGYRVGDRLLRPTKVAVARAPEDQSPAEQG
jgi:molecular chaperone GrpE